MAEIKFNGVSGNPELSNQILKRMATSPETANYQSLNIHFDVLPRELFLIWCKRIFRKRSLNQTEFTVLVRAEPRVVLPSSYTKFSAAFNLVLDLGFRNGSGIPWPQQEESITLTKHLSLERLSQFCMIAANKTSFINGELYSLRKEICSEDARVHLYGRGWGKESLQSKFFTTAKSLVYASIKVNAISLSSIFRWHAKSPNSRGEVDSKFRVYSKYKYALVIENEATYVSEKLFDALMSGCIPVYVGPTNNFVDSLGSLIVRSEANTGSVRRAMDLAMEKDYSAWRDSLTALVDSGALQVHSYKAVSDLLCDAILDGIIRNAS